MAKKNLLKNMVLVGIGHGKYKILRLSGDRAIPEAGTIQTAFVEFTGSFQATMEWLLEYVKTAE